MKKSILMVSIVFVVMAFIYERYRSQHNLEANDVSVEFGSAVSAPSSSSFEKENGEVKSDNPSASSLADNKTTLDAAALEVVTQWKMDRGYMPNDASKIDEYDNFDVKTLKIMSDSGDVLAQTELISRLMGEERKKETDKALTMGSTAALVNAGVDFRNKYNSASSDEQRHEILLNWLALCEFGVLRGDRYFKIDAEYSLLHNINLSDGDRDKISKRGKMLYEEFQRQRTELGLDDFDNSVPPEVQEFYDELDRSYAAMKP